MRHVHVSFPRRVGVAPGTTTINMQGAGEVSMVSPPMPVISPIAADTFPFANVPSWTQATYQPVPNSANVRFSMPPNQRFKGPTDVMIEVPPVQSTFGPVPNDLELATTTPGYLPVRKGWVSTEVGKIFGLQGGLGDMNANEKWTVAASIIGTLALTTMTIIAVMRYHNETRH